MKEPKINSVENKLSPASPGLIMASLILWGWQTDYMIYAISMGVILELPHFFKWRINFSDTDINQLADLSGVLFFITIIYVFINYSFHGIYKILELLPFSLFILVLAQNYSIQNSIKTSALFISVRRLGDNANEDILYYTNICLPYIFLCLISASSGNKHQHYFFIFSIFIILWMLWNQKIKHYSFIYWLTAIIFIVFISFATQQGIQNLHAKAETLFLHLFEQYGFRSRNPDSTSTSIGSLGRLKLSDRIIFRIKSDNTLTTPLYFQETNYSKYQNGIWRNKKSNFDVIKKTPEKKEWRLNDQLQDIGYFDIAIFFQEETAIIPAPRNINTIYGNDIIQVETNTNDSTKIEAHDGWINYRLGIHGKTSSNSSNPVTDNLTIPLSYQSDFKKIASELELYSKTPEEVIRTVKSYFKDNFYYSISQNQRYTKGRYLTNFLFKDKKGHCEYFATATALLLREAGIPTRYMVGYSVQEYSAWQKMYLVRARHAHSWINYYINGEWHQLDTTPSIWAPMEAEDKTLLEPFLDLLSWLRYKITGGDVDTKTNTNNWLLWLLFPFIAYLGRRFYKKQRIDSAENTDSNSELKKKYFGQDSPLYPVIELLQKKSDKKLPGETLSKWIKRVMPEAKTERYLNLIKIHNRYRFNPVSNKQNDRKAIKKLIDTM